MRQVVLAAAAATMVGSAASAATYRFTFVPDGISEDVTPWPSAPFPGEGLIRGGFTLTVDNLINLDLSYIWSNWCDPSCPPDESRPSSGEWVMNETPTSSFIMGPGRAHNHLILRTDEEGEIVNISFYIGHDRPDFNFGHDWATFDPNGNNMFRTTGSWQIAAHIPLPASIYAMMLGLGAFGLVRRKSRRPIPA